METVTGLLIEKVKGTTESILSVEENLGILENKIEDLSCRKKDVQAELCTTQVWYGQKPRSEVESWLEKVQKIKNEAPDIRQKVGELRRSQICERMNLAKCVEEKIKVVDELRANGQFLNGLFVNSLPCATKTFPPVKLVGEKTALKNMKMIEECLMDDEVGKIGVFGMGGVGKTTIMTQIYNKIQNANTFDRVIWVTVSRDSFVEKLQYDVSKALGLNLFNDHATDRSAELFRAFNHMGRFLLILDDMWNAFPLDKIGIPEPNEENKCKIVWTTRSKKVCRGMGCHKPVKVECLTEDESWTLFKEKLGAIDMSPELEPIAKNVVEECDGLPLAIIIVGAAMSYVHDISEWRNALTELRNSSTEMVEGMEDEVFTCLKFSFVKLKTQRLQDCFLYCALYPEDSLIGCRRLIEYWMADGLLDETEERDERFDKGYTIINHLKDACMLESVTDDRVKMHDLLRDLAINITRKSPKFVVKAGFRVKQFSWDENLMTGAVRVSLTRSDIRKLSCQPKSCPELSTLFLQDSKLEEIHHLFFEYMLNLRVLDLSRTGIKCLPHSISNLGKLRALLLRYCWKLKEVPSLAKLKKLTVLDLSFTAFKYLSEGLEGLTNLKCLDLSGTFELETFPAGIIRNLSCLEELDMRGSKLMWSSNGNEGGACVEEMLRLTHLRELYVRFADLNAFNCYVRSGHWRNLKYFNFQIPNEGVEPWSFQIGIAFAELHGTRKVGIGPLPINFMSSVLLPDNTLELCITHSNDVTSLSEIPSMWSLKQLMTCSILACEKMEYVLTKDQSNPFLPTLNDLDIFNSIILRSICKDPRPTGSGSLTNLKTIKIFDCPNLKHVFSVGWLQALQNLEVIIVSCFEKAMDELEEMVVEIGDMGESSNDNDNSITLPRLRILDLKNLRKLKSISKRIFVCNSLEEITVDSCPKLKKVPFSINSIPPSLKSIQGSNEWWDSLEWDDSEIQSRLQLFFSSKVDEYCHSVEDEDEDDDEYEEDDDEDEDEDEDDDAADGEEEKHGTKRKADALM